ncbi:BspA family leucine-rich repeat surface protein [Helicobacter typhlonius]
MFEDAKKFNQPLDKWNVKNVEYIACIFKGAKSFAQNIDS